MGAVDKIIEGLRAALHETPSEDAWLEVWDRVAAAWTEHRGQVDAWLPYALEGAKGWPERLRSVDSEGLDLIFEGGAALAPLARFALVDGLPRLQKLWALHPHIKVESLTLTLGLGNKGRIGEAELAALLVDRRLEGLKYLSLANQYLGGDAGRALARSEVMGAVTTLTTRGSYFSNFTEMIPERWGALRALHLAGSGLEARDMARLAGSGLLERLEVLNLESNRIGAEGLEALGGAGLGSLRTLKLGHNQLGDAAVAAWARSLGAEPSKLSHLDLAHDRLRGEALEALASCEALRGLGWLKLNGNNLGAGGLAAISGASWLGTLTALDLSSNMFGPAGAAALSTGLSAPKLGSLKLSGNRMRSAGVEALASEATLPALLWLDLAGELIDAAGVRALIGAPFFGQLVALDLAGNALGDEGAAVLAEASAGALSTLHLGGNEIGVEGLEVLVKGRIFKGLRYATLGYNRFGEGDLGALQPACAAALSAPGWGGDDARADDLWAAIEAARGDADHLETLDSERLQDIHAVGLEIAELLQGPYYDGEPVFFEHVHSMLSEDGIEDLVAGLMGEGRAAFLRALATPYGYPRDTGDVANRGGVTLYDIAEVLRGRGLDVDEDY